MFIWKLQQEVVGAYLPLEGLQPGYPVQGVVDANLPLEGLQPSKLAVSGGVRGGAKAVMAAWDTGPFQS